MIAPPIPTTRPRYLRRLGLRAILALNFWMLIFAITLQLAAWWWVAAP